MVATSLLSRVAEWSGHKEAEMAEHNTAELVLFDRARRSLDRHATYIVWTFIAGATRSARSRQPGDTEHRYRPAPPEVCGGWFTDAGDTERPRPGAWGYWRRQRGAVVRNPVAQYGRRHGVEL